MSLSGGTSSPSFRNVVIRQKQSPIEMKEKFRKNYKEKIQRCRNLLINNFRGVDHEGKVENTLNEVYKSILYNFNDSVVTNDEEHEFFQEMKKEFLLEELTWLNEEHEKSQMENVDWSSIEDNSDVICPLCQKLNLVSANGSVICMNCKLRIKTHKTLEDLKNDIMNCVEQHNMKCYSSVGFVKMPDPETHLYLFCSTCNVMQLVI